jgi:hypothetical protein
MNGATQNTLEGIRSTISAIDTKAEKLAEIDRLAKVAFSKAVGEECLFLTVGSAIVSEWKTEGAAMRAARFMTRDLGKKNVSVEFDADLGWITSSDA